MPRQYDSDDVYIAPTIALANKTVIYDKLRSMNVMLLEGVITLPPGSTIQLADPIIDAIVIGNRLLPGDERTPAMLCIDVQVPDVWWEHVYRV